MAMTDYFISCNKIENRLVSDGLGGYITVEYVGVAFMGLPVKGGITTQVVGAIKDKEKNSLQFHTYENIPLTKGDKVKYNEKGQDKYIILTSNVIVNTEKSMQTDWVTYLAEDYTPTGIVENG